MDWRLFADLAETAGAHTVSVDADGVSTVEDALAALFERHPALRDVVLEDGSVAPHLTILRNGTAVDDGLDAVVSPEDELALFPPISGG